MVNVLPPIVNLKRAALNMLFPRWCIGCGKEGKYLCDTCYYNLKHISPPVCSRCGRPIVTETDATGCPGCSAWQGEIDGIRAPFLFDGVIRNVIHEFKYQNLRAAATELAGLIHSYIKENPVPGNVLVPVPLHPKKLHERGYNQSALITRELGRLANLPVMEYCLVRQKYTSPQARSSSIEERRKNLSGAFTCRDGRFQDKQVILIDDVSTSGTTLNTCAIVLKAAGAATVWGLVIALEL
jgi:ComF family protein